MIRISMAAGFISKMRLEGFGTIWLARTDRGICRILLKGGRHKLLNQLPKRMEWRIDHAPFRQLNSKFRAYASGNKVSFGQPFDLINGTPFQRAVWRKIATIPWGEVRSYAWLARAIGRPRAIRAVGSACGANPIPIIIPCHRVIGSNGSLGGFTGGLKLKSQLLAIEGIQI